MNRNQSLVAQEYAFIGSKSSALLPGGIVASRCLGWDVCVLACLEERLGWAFFDHVADR